MCYSKPYCKYCKQNFGFATNSASQDRKVSSNRQICHSSHTFRASSFLRRMDKKESNSLQPLSFRMTSFIQLGMTHLCLFFFFLSLASISIASKPSPTAQPQCTWQPDPGECRGFFRRYFYNMETQVRPKPTISCLPSLSSVTRYSPILWTLCWD